MKLATFQACDGPRPAAVVGEELADLSAVPDGPTDILTLLSDGHCAERVERLLKTAPRFPIAEAQLRAPVPRPGKFLAIGLNAPDHRRDVNIGWLMREPGNIRLALGYLIAHPRPRYPFFFAKATSSIIGPYDPIWIPTGAKRTDWEGELAVVIGRHAHRLTPATARDVIAGYMIANDVSVRDWQTDNPTGPLLAKGYDTHGPLGPFLVTPDKFDVADLELRTLLNGRLRQHGRIGDLIHSPAEIVSILSGFCTLQPGDVIACGTFAGTGWPAGRFLRPGDTVRIEIDGLGHIENPVIPEPTHP